MLTTILTWQAIIAVIMTWGWLAIGVLFVIGVALLGLIGGLIKLWNWFIGKEEQQ